MTTRSEAELEILRKARQKFREIYGHDTELWQELVDDNKNYPEKPDEENEDGEE